MAHREPGADEQTEAEERVGGEEARLPERGNLRVARERGRREDGAADELEGRGERVEDETPEPVVDRLAHARLAG